jgi:hypothetical protein
MRFDDAYVLWLDGARRLARAEPQDQAALERVTEAVVDELRRRLGGPFTTAELAQLYTTDGTDWVFAIATRVAPGNPAAWEIPTVGGAAFARYAREASDFRTTQTLEEADQGDEEA